MRNSILLMSFLATISSPAFAQSMHVTANQPTSAPTEGYLEMGTGKGPNGSIGINSRFITRDGRPWFPVMGEFHFTRYPANEWEDELLKMKAAGVNTVAAYIIWNHHELAPGKLDWSGNRDLRRFAELCAKHGLNLFIRPGPWVHAEVRFGGIPDWIVERTQRRTNDPLYMAEVERFWSGVAEQLRGLLWKDGGPVLGMQIENEYNLTGPGKGAEHISALKALAVKLGLDLPLYTVTGWDNAAYPRGKVAPVDGAYVDEPWGISTKMQTPRPAHTFRFEAEMATGLGAQTQGDKSRIPDAIKDRPYTPYLGAEFGSGLPVMYRRRPIVEPDDVASTILTQMGSGLNLIGYYMFHGGVNPTANGRGLEETAREGAFNDVPKISYDFQAALGQYGEVNPVQGYLRPLHYFVESFGDRFAKTTLKRPDIIPANADDLKTPRIAVRSDGRTGFVFMNNHVRNHDMARQSNVRFDIDLPGQKLSFPSRPMTVENHRYFFFPFNMDLDGLNLSWASAQPIATINSASGPLFIFSAVDSIPVELAFATGSIKPGKLKTRSWEGNTLVDATPSKKIIELTTASGKTVKILVLSQEDSRRLWVFKSPEGDRAVVSDAAVFAQADDLILRQTGSSKFQADVWPALPSSALLRKTGTSGGLISYAGSVPAKAPVKIDATLTRPIGTARPIDMFGPNGSAVQPAPEAYDAAGVWSFTVPASALEGVEDGFLTIDYTGDVARLFDRNMLMDDMFWDGRKWHIGLKRFREHLSRSWDLAILPLRSDAPIYLEQRVKPSFGSKSQIAELRSIILDHQYELRVRAKN